MAPLLSESGQVGGASQFRGLTPVQVALGTAIGSAPRAFSYTALVRAATTGNGRLGVIAVVVAVVVSLVGAAAGFIVLRRHRAVPDDRLR